jgi:hypothetical protein
LCKLPNVEVAKLRKSTPNGRLESWIATVYTTLNAADRLDLMSVFMELTATIVTEA